MYGRGCHWRGREDEGREVKGPEQSSLWGKSIKRRVSVKTRRVHHGNEKRARARCVWEVAGSPCRAKATVKEVEKKRAYANELPSLHTTSAARSPHGSFGNRGKLPWLTL